MRPAPTHRSARAWLVVAALASCSLSASLFAQGRPPRGAARPPDMNRRDSVRPTARDSMIAGGPGFLAKLEAPPVVTHHSMTLNGQVLRYTATTGILPIRNDTTGAPEGGMFYVAYTLDGADAGKRPLTFAFNGGPGSATVWLHLGAFGPERVKLLPNGAAAPPPYDFEQNPYTLLDQTDIVFLDPVGTGFSRAVRPELGPKFWGLDEDIRAVGEFIRLYLTRYERWGSPKFLAGESYGTTRAAGLSGYLVDHGIALNGIILLSAVLEFEASADDPGNDIGFINFLPSYTSTAWFHKKLPPDLQALPLEQAMAQSEKWASTDYTLALQKGSRMTPAERQQAIDQMARFTGLSKDFIDHNNLRVTLSRFDQELLRDQDLTTGRLDSRFTSFSQDPAGERGAFDPSEANIRNSFTPVLSEYVRQVLGYDNEDIYYILGGGIGRWRYPQRMGYPSVTPSLERAFAKNPAMKLFVAMGYYDMATPYYAVEYTLAHLDVSPAARQNISTDHFAAGHMMYIDESSMKKLRSDLATFIDGALRAP